MALEGKELEVYQLAKNFIAVYNSYTNDSDKREKLAQLRKSMLEKPLFKDLAEDSFAALYKAGLPEETEYEQKMNEISTTLVTAWTNVEGEKYYDDIKAEQVARNPNRRATNEQIEELNKATYYNRMSQFYNDAIKDDKAVLSVDEMKKEYTADREGINAINEQDDVPKMVDETVKLFELDYMVKRLYDVRATLGADKKNSGIADRAYGPKEITEYFIDYGKKGNFEKAKQLESEILDAYKDIEKNCPSINNDTRVSENQTPDRVSFVPMSVKTKYVQQAMLSQATAIMDALEITNTTNLAAYGGISNKQDYINKLDEVYFQRLFGSDTVTNDAPTKVTEESKAKDYAIVASVFASNSSMSITTHKAIQAASNAFIAANGLLEAAIDNKDLDRRAAYHAKVDNTYIKMTDTIIKGQSIEDAKGMDVEELISLKNPRDFNKNRLGLPVEKVKPREVVANAKLLSEKFKENPEIDDELKVEMLFVIAEKGKQALNKVSLWDKFWHPIINHRNKQAVAEMETSAKEAQDSFELGNKAVTTIEPEKKPYPLDLDKNKGKQLSADIQKQPDAPKVELKAD